MDLPVRLFNLHVMRKRLKSHHSRDAQREQSLQADLPLPQHQSFLKKGKSKRIRLQGLAMITNWSNKMAW
jgi:hypothetical protein